MKTVQEIAADIAANYDLSMTPLQIRPWADAYFTTLSNEEILSLAEDHAEALRQSVNAGTYALEGGAGHIDVFLFSLSDANRDKWQALHRAHVDEQETRMTLSDIASNLDDDRHSLPLRHLFQAARFLDLANDPSADELTTKLAQLGIGQEQAGALFQKAAQIVFATRRRGHDTNEQHRPSQTEVLATALAGFAEPGIWFNSQYRNSQVERLGEEYKFAAEMLKTANNDAVVGAERPAAITPNAVLLQAKT